MRSLVVDFCRITCLLIPIDVNAQVCINSMDQCSRELYQVVMDGVSFVKISRWKGDECYIPEIVLASQ